MPVRVLKSSASLLKDAKVGPNLMPAPWAAAEDEEPMSASTAESRKTSEGSNH